MDPDAWPGEGISPANKAILLIVLVSVAVAVAETEPAVHEAAPSLFWLANVAFASLFAAEYVIRIWVMGERREFAGLGGRLRYAVKWYTICDLIATIALWATLFVEMSVGIGVMFRFARVLRVLSLMKNSRWSEAMKLIGQSVSSRRRELILSFALSGIVLLFSASLLYVCEGWVQKEAFGSIPRATWWAVATLTTVGYGDVYPITVAGKIFAGISAIAAIGIVAMPTGIMASAFSDAFKALHDKSNGQSDDA